MPLNHASVKIAGQPLAAVVDWNSAHVITGGVLDIGANNFIVDTDVLFVDAGTDRVGVGIANPLVKAHVYVNDASLVTQRIEQAGGGDAALGFTLSAVAGWIIGVDNSDGDKFKISNSGTDLNLSNRITFDQVGNVGIGTTAPATLLELSQPGSGNILTFDRAGTNIASIGLTSNVLDFNIETGAPGFIWFNNDQNDADFRIGSVVAATSFSMDATTGNVGIGTAAAAASAALDIVSTLGALLLPRMTTAQRNALGAVNGMIIYNSNTNKIEGYEAGAWVDI